MLLDKLRVNQLSPQGWAWYQQYLTVLDVLEALNHYVRDGDGADARPITVRATAWTDRNPDGQVQSVRLYQDVSPLYSGSSAGTPTSAASGGQA
jgi:hypothetical protein